MACEIGGGRTGNPLRVDPRDQGVERQAFRLGRQPQRLPEDRLEADRGRVAGDHDRAFDRAHFTSAVIPAKAGISLPLLSHSKGREIPASAGMTETSVNTYAAHH